MSATCRENTVDKHREAAWAQTAEDPVEGCVPRGLAPWLAGYSMLKQTGPTDLESVARCGTAFAASSPLPLRPPCHLSAARDRRATSTVLRFGLGLAAVLVVASAAPALAQSITISPTVVEEVSSGSFSVTVSGFPASTDVYLGTQGCGSFSFSGTTAMRTNASGGTTFSVSYSVNNEDGVACTINVDDGTNEATASLTIKAVAPVLTVSPTRIDPGATRELTFETSNIKTASINIKTLTIRNGTGCAATLLPLDVTMNITGTRGAGSATVSVTAGSERGSCKPSVVAILLSNAELNLPSDSITPTISIAPRPEPDPTPEPEPEPERPVVSRATVNGTTLVLTFDERLSERSVPAGDAFTVRAARGVWEHRR